MHKTMAKVKKQKTEKNTNELLVAVTDLRSEIHKLSLNHAKRQLKQTSLLRVKKDELARMLTKLNMQKFIENNSGKEKIK